MINLGKSLLTKFLNLMSKDIAESDLELIVLGKSLGLDLVSFAELRESQDDDFVDKVRRKSLEILAINNDNQLSSDDSFYAGSIDFMVSDNPKGKKFFLLETNGGSNRGLSIITEKQQELMYDGYLLSILQAINKQKQNDKRVLILIGVPINDALIHEKVILIEFLRRKLKERNFRLKIFNLDNYDKDFLADLVFLIADYKQLSSNLSFDDNWVKFKEEKVDVLIGDGIARRIDDKWFKTTIKKDFRKINTIIVNPIYQVTDDKSLTYLASYFNKDILKKYNLRYLSFTKAFNEKEIIDKVHFLIKKCKKSFIIKPSGGSGGAGVMHISKDADPEKIKKIIQASKKEFFNKFQENRNPYPYTIQEMADFSLIDWKGGKHTFDLRIYLTQRKGFVIPIGGLARIARGSYIGGLTKEEFVVNLSGYSGQIEVERGIGFSKKNSSILNLDFKDFVNMFCIGCVLFKTITENYYKIVNFTDWDQIISSNSNEN